MKKIPFFLITACLTACFVSPAFAQSYAITGATIVTVTDETIHDGAVVIEGDKIAAVGVNVNIPSGAVRIDASGKFVYPGMIDPNTSLGLADVSGIWQTTDNTETGTYNTYLRASQGLNPNSRQINIQRFTGVTSAIAVPRGGVISGQEVLLNLDGWSLEELTVEDPVAMSFTFPSATSRGRGRRGSAPPAGGSADAQKTAEKQLEDIKSLLAKTRHYIKAMEEFEAHQRQTPPPADMVLMGLVPVVQGTIPMTITVNGVDDIRKAIAFVKEEKIAAVFAGATDAYKIADEIAEANIPVLYADLLRTPGMEEPYDLYYTIPAVLQRAGVKFAFSIPSHSEVRNLPFMAGMAVAYGLPKEEAVKAVTLYPAQMYMVDDILGSIETGKMANLVVTDGHLLEPRTHITDMFIRGVRVDLTAGEDYKLYEKYLNRPKKKGIK